MSDFCLGSPPFKRACPDSVTYREGGEAGGFFYSIKDQKFCLLNGKQ